MDPSLEASNTDLMTLTRFVLNEQSKHPEARGDLTILLSNIVLGCKFVCSAVNKVGTSAGLAPEEPPRSCLSCSATNLTGQSCLLASDASCLLRCLGVRRLGWPSSSVWLERRMCRQVFTLSAPAFALLKSDCHAFGAGSCS